MMPSNTRVADLRLEALRPGTCQRASILAGPLPPSGDDSDSNELRNREHQAKEIQHWRRLSDDEHLPIRQMHYAKLLYLLAMGR
jgi:hypothetical protein